MSQGMYKIENRKLTKNVFGAVHIDENYDYREEIEKQIEIIKNRF